MPKFERLELTRIVALEEALETAVFPPDALELRIASDELLLLPAQNMAAVDDPHAIIVIEGGFAGAWVEAERAAAFLRASCEWELPVKRPAFAQGAVADIPTKLWLEDERVLFVVPAAYAATFARRMEEGA